MRKVASPQTEAGTGPGPSITIENSHCRREVIKNIVSIIVFEQNHPELLFVVLESLVPMCRSDAHRLGWLRGNGELHLSGALGWSQARGALGGQSFSWKRAGLRSRQMSTAVDTRLRSEVG